MAPGSLKLNSYATPVRIIACLNTSTSKHSARAKTDNSSWELQLTWALPKSRKDCETQGGDFVPVFNTLVTEWIPGTKVF